MTKNRQALLAILAVVAVFAVYRDPSGTAETVRAAFDLFAETIHGVFEFAGALTG